LAPTPFEHGLALAWSDGALSREGAKMLEELQKKLKMSDDERSIQEEAWLNEISKNDRRSFGDGDQILREWLDTLSDYESMASAIKSMGRSALNVGLSKQGWIEAYSFAEGLGLGNDLATGVWLEEEVEPIKEWPPALDPLAIILGLAVSMTDFFPKKEVEYIDGNPSIIVSLENTKPSQINWMNELSPLNGHSCAWGMSHSDQISGFEVPQGDLVYHNTILSSWIRKVISMRNNRGENSLSGLPNNFTVMPSSANLSVSDNKITLSVIVDLGESGLVKPFASVTISDSVNPDKAPENLPASWIAIHDGLGQLLMHAIDTLPKQILLASGLSDLAIEKITLSDGWIVVQTES